MRHFFIPFLVALVMTSGFLYGVSTTSKIKNSQKTLSATSSAKKKANRRLEKIAKDIKSAEKDIVFLEKKIDELAESKIKTEKKYEKLKKELSIFEQDFKETSRSLERKRKKFISLLSEQFSIVFAMEQAHEPTRESIILHEVYTAYKKQNTQSLASLRSDISTLKKRKKSKLYLRNKTKKEIASIIKKRDAYAQKKAAKEKLLKKLSVDEEKYNAKLEKIVDKQNSLRSTLAKLNILHAQEVEESRKIAAAKKEAMRLEKERQRKIRKAKALARAKARKAKEDLHKATTEKQRVKARLAAKKQKQKRKKSIKRVQKLDK